MADTGGGASLEDLGQILKTNLQLSDAGKVDQG